MSIKRPLDKAWDQDMYVDYQYPYHGYYMPWKYDKGLVKERYGHKGHEEKKRQGKYLNSKHVHWIREGYDELEEKVIKKEAEIEELKKKIIEKEKEQEIKNQEKTIEKLKEKINSQERILKRRKIAAAEAEKKNILSTKAHKERAQKLNSSFTSILGKIEENGINYNVEMATTYDIERILKSKNDYECLKVSCHDNLNTVRKKYKEIALSIHPDRCSLNDATNAFQRVQVAYENLGKILSDDQDF